MGKEKEDSQKKKIAREETPVTDILSARQRITGLVPEEVSLTWGKMLGSLMFSTAIPGGFGL